MNFDGTSESDSVAGAFANAWRVKTPQRLGQFDLQTSPLGGLAEWYWGLPAVLQLLANPEAQVGVPECPLVRDNHWSEEVHVRARTYWLCLEHILRYHLGWTHPAQGLAKWIDAGAPPDGNHLALVRWLWLGDGVIHRYIAWRKRAFDDHVPGSWDRRIRPHREGFENSQGGHGAIGSVIGPEGLHLEFGGHTDKPEIGLPEEPIAILTKNLVGDEPAKLILLSDAKGWYQLLKRQNEPSLFPQRTAVVSRTMGWIGEFEQSGTTGRWHATREDIHLLGTRGT